MRRKQALAVNHIYHVYNRSIAGYNIFPSQQHYARFERLLFYYQLENLDKKFSSLTDTETFYESVIHLHKTKKRCVDILAYCLMPNHFHLILKQNCDNGISNFMRNIQNSYSHFFNVRHNRQGPLWAGKFKNVLCESDEQLLHLSRYIHLNPSTAQLVQKPEHWIASSYKEYLAPNNLANPICHFKQHIAIKKNAYRKFVENHIDAQRKLAKIKHLLFD